MNRKSYVRLLVIRDDEDSQNAIDLVTKMMDKDEFEICFCPKDMAEEYTMPFISDENQSPWSGLEGIKYFLEKRKTITAT